MRPQITDIVNKEVANLTNCDQEPIHIPGSIQENGCLLAVHKISGSVDFCSNNTEIFISLPPAQVLNRHINEVLSPGIFDKIAGYTSAQNHLFADPFIIQLNGKIFVTKIHESGSFYIMEIEEDFERNIETARLYQQFFTFSRDIQDIKGLDILCQFVAEEIRKQTGYDRVMVYRFDKDYNGEIFAEAKKDMLDPFLGLHYPHTDIPVQARKLYIKNLIRIITDINYTPVPIVTIDDGKKSAGDLDLSLSVLRSTSPIHIEYLKNMGVGATLTVSLLKNNDLWGLIACHHYGPKKLPHHIRNICLLQSSFLASQISLREAEELYSLNNSIQSRLNELLVNIYLHKEHVVENIINNDLLPSIANAVAVIIISKNKIYKKGNLPADNDIYKLASGLIEKADDRKFVTDNLISVYEPARFFPEMISGVVMVKLNSSFNDCIIWCRPEIPKMVNWAGNPEKKGEEEDPRIRLSPRKSFELWKQKVRFNSLPWNQPEIEAAVAFTNALERQLYVLFLAEEEDKQRRLGVQLSRANKELENINWISTHDLKEPLRKIRVFSSLIMDKEAENLPEQVSAAMKKINLSAERMQKLIEDIMLYGNIRSVTPEFEPVSLNVLLAEIVSELKEEIEDKNAVIKLGPLPVINGIPFQIRQLFVNLVTNALKFSDPERNNFIEVSSKSVSRKTENGLPPYIEQLYHEITVQDTGTGFDQKYVSKIFEMFQRLHSNKISGTGIGLAICKKIMDTHNGIIEAKGETGAGAVFNLYFPVTFENE